MCVSVRACELTRYDDVQFDVHLEVIAAVRRCCAPASVDPSSSSHRREGMESMRWVYIIL